MWTNFFFEMYKNGLARLEGKSVSSFIMQVYDLEIVRKI